MIFQKCKKNFRQNQDFLYLCNHEKDTFNSNNDSGFGFLYESPEANLSSAD